VSVRGAGGYQMFGITPAPIYDPTQSLPDFTDFMVFFRPGDIVRFRPVDRDEYDTLLASVEAKEFRIRQAPVEFALAPFLDDPDGYNARLLEVLA
jgi:urea carboxylase